MNYYQNPNTDNMCPVNQKQSTENNTSSADTQNISNIQNTTIYNPQNMSDIIQSNKSSTHSSNNIRSMTNNNQMQLNESINNYPISSGGDESRMPETMTNNAFIPAYLRHQIGKWMRIEFLVGNIMEEKVGQLIDVGASYLILKMLEPSTTMLCDIYSVKFITIIYDAKIEKLYTR